MRRSVDWVAFVVAVAWVIYWSDSPGVFLAALILLLALVRRWP